MDEREVGLADVGVGRELFGKRPHRGLRLRHHHEAGRVLVEAVDDSRTRHAADAFQGWAMVEKRVYERAGEVPGRWVDDESSGLVDDYDVLVLEYD